MYIANAGLFVKDLEGAKKFFEDYFGAELAFAYNEEENKYYSYIMKLGDGAKIELMTKPEIVDEPKDPNRSGIAHIAIRMATREALTDVIAKFHALGYKFFYEPGPNGGNEARMMTFEDNVLEVSFKEGEPVRMANTGIFVKDLEGAKKFFEDYFGATVAFEYNEEDAKYYSYIMNVGDGAKLELMTKPEVVDLPKEPNRTGFAHVAIRVDSREKLNEIIEKFHAANYKFFYEPATTGGRELRAVTFEDIVLEVSCEE